MLIVNETPAEIGVKIWNNTEEGSFLNSYIITNNGYISLSDNDNLNYNSFKNTILNQGGYITSHVSSNVKVKHGSAYYDSYMKFYAFNSATLEMYIYDVNNNFIVSETSRVQIQKSG